MKVLLTQNVSSLGHIGEVVEVKPGYARNYLVPYGYAVQPTDANLKAVEEAKQQYLAERARIQAEQKARAEALDGTEITIAARANEEGHLYGSVGPAQIVAALAEKDLIVEEDKVKLDHPIRQLDKYDVRLHFGEDAEATISVWVVPVREEGAAKEVDAATPEAEAYARAEGETITEEE